MLLFLYPETPLPAPCIFHRRLSQQQAPAEAEAAAGEDDQGPVPQQGGGSGNALLSLLAGLSQEKDLAFLVNGMAELLNNPLQAYYMPNSYKTVDLHRGTSGDEGRNAGFVPSISIVPSVSLK